MDLYEALGVPRTASPAEIKTAYKRLASRYHPDRKGGDTVKFQIVQRAYDTLSDKDLRSHYDKFGETVGGPSIRERAMQTLLTIFAQTIDNEKNDIDGHNIVEYLTESVERTRDGMPGRIEKAKKKIQRFERARSRLKVRKGQDLIGQMLDRQILGMKQNLVGLAQEAQVGDEMLKILEDYEYKVDFSDWKTALQQ